MLPGALAMGLAGPLIGRIYDRWGTRVLLVPGSFIASARAVVLHDLRRVHLDLGRSRSRRRFCRSVWRCRSRRCSPHRSARCSRASTRTGPPSSGTVQQVAGAAGIALMITIMASVTADAVAERCVRGRLPAPQGAQAAFLIAAIVSLPLIVGAFLIRKPADQQVPRRSATDPIPARYHRGHHPPRLGRAVVTCWARPSLGRGP